MQKKYQLNFSIHALIVSSISSGLNSNPIVFVISSHNLLSARHQPAESFLEANW
ncbi:MAG: hypothetical protein J6T10_08195 [Methanobrevibacter sp.]|nr:hypothetical protein [Methanobrevibacter sp.]